MSHEALEDHDIFVRSEDTLASLFDCPRNIKGLCTLILSVQSVEWNFFGGELSDSCSVQATPVMQYESELKLEAEHLTKICLDRDRPDDPEERFVQLLQPVVFYRFDREAEEAYNRSRHHHCFICGKHFPFQSRPLLNNRYHRDPRIHDRDSEDADVCKEHLNFSNFCFRRSTYIKDEAEGRKTPDLTIGLLAWSENSWHAPPNMTVAEMENILEHNLVKPFRHDTLDRLEKDGLIESLFVYPKPKRGTRVERTKRSSVAFPFAIWEAKRASEGNPVAQNILKIKVILKWQQALAKRANVSWVPLVFHFVSVGSEWKIYVCHVQPSMGLTKRKDTFLLRLLWSGNCVNQTKALQLLCLVDIIALWGQFQYKPFAGACVRILEKKSEARGSLQFLKTRYLDQQKPIDANHFRTLQSYGIATGGSTRSMFTLRRAGTDTSVREITAQFTQGMRSLSLDHYFIPERDGFIWLLHRGLSRADLLVVRVNNGGSVLPPVVIFRSSDWKSHQFERIAREERARIPQNLATEFRHDKDRKSVLGKCFSPTTGYCTVPDIQFCAILPLKRQRRAGADVRAEKRLERLERLLGLEELINKAERAKDEWCICHKPESEDMISCDATKCPTGWFHKECVGVDRDYKAQDWFCPGCKALGNIVFSTYDNNEENFDKEVLDRSDVRVQRARSLNRVWNSHRWPDASEVQDLMYNNICCGIEMETDTRKFRNTVDCLEAEKDTSVTQQWAIHRNNPLQITQMRRRFRSEGRR